jgi:hypothetical protein
LGQVSVKFIKKKEKEKEKRKYFLVLKFYISTYVKESNNNNSLQNRSHSRAKHRLHQTNKLRQMLTNAPIKMMRNYIIITQIN